MKLKKIIVSGNEITAGISIVSSPVKYDSQIWPIILAEKLQIKHLINLAINGGGVVSMVTNLITFLENENIENGYSSDDTLIIFNITDLCWFDLLCEKTIPPVYKKEFPWEDYLGLSWLQLKNYDKDYAVEIRKIIGKDQSILWSSVMIIALFNYLENNKFCYYYMYSHNSILDNAPVFLKDFLKTRNSSHLVNFEENLNVLELCKKYNEIDEDTNNLSVHGHMRIAQILHDKISKELINTNKGL